MSTDVTESATFSDRVAEEILSLMGRRRINKAEMARRLGVKEDWIGRRLNGRQRLDVDDLARIAPILGVTVLDLLPKPDVTGRQPTAQYLPGERLIATIGDSALDVRPTPRRRTAHRARPITEGSIRPLTPVGR